MYIVYTVYTHHIFMHGYYQILQTPQRISWKKLRCTDWIGLLWKTWQGGMIDGHRSDNRDRLYSLYSSHKLRLPEWAFSNIKECILHNIVMQWQKIYMTELFKTWRADAIMPIPKRGDLWECTDWGALCSSHPGKVLVLAMENHMRIAVDKRVS